MRAFCTMKRVAATLSTVALVAASSVAFVPDVAADATDGTLTVIVDRDYLGTGVYDPTVDNNPVPGIPVTVTDASGHAVAGTTDASGQVVITASGTLTGGRYRVEATIPASLPYLRPAPAQPAGTTNAFSSLTSFVSVAGGANVTVRMGVWNPADYSQNNPPVGVPIQASAAPSNGEAITDTRSALLLPWTARGALTGTTAPTQVTSQAQVGTTYGMAYDRYGQRLFQSAFAKRFTAYGPAGAGAIYVHSATTTTSVAPTVFAVVPNAGTSAKGTNGYARDSSFFDAPGHESLGGMAISEDGSTLAVVNLFEKSIYEYPVADTSGNPPATVVPLPNPSGAAACAAATDWQPSTVAYKDGQLYVGGICTAASSVSAANPAGDRSLLKVVVERVTGSTVTPAFAHDLLYAKGYTYGPLTRVNLSKQWNPWQSTYDTTLLSYASNPGSRPEPELTSIAFDRSGAMLLGFRDRFMDQVGSFAADDPATSTTYGEIFSGGDVRHACADGSGGWIFEGDTGCTAPTYTASSAENGGDPTTEFYHGDFYGTSHQEIFLGGLGLALRMPQFVGSAFDPWTYYRQQGLGWNGYSDGKGPGNDHNANGAALTSAASSNNPSGLPNNGFQKGSGLGGIAVLAGLAPVQIGNRVWIDANRDGVQDAGEPAAAGVTVQLIDGSGTVLGTATTDANGEYYFTGNPETAAANGTSSVYVAGLTTGTAYTVRLPAANFGSSGVLDHYVATRTGVGTDRAVDSNGAQATPTGNDDAAVTTGGPGENDHTIDFGVVPLLSLGNRLWFDTGGGTKTDNGVFDAGESPVVGATVQLLDAGGGVLATTTDANGYYRFDDLAAGDYRVRVAAANFASGGVLASYVSSTGAVTTFTTATNNQDKGLDSADPATTGITSSTVTLSATNPTGDLTTGASGAGAHGPTGDVSDNLTVDFGFVQPFDLQLTKTVTSTGPYQVNSTATFALVVRNNGPGAADSGFTVSDLLPAGLSYVSATGSNWTATTSGQTVTLTHSGGLASGASAETVTLTATVTATSAGTLKNQAFVAPAPTQHNPETNPLGTGNGGYEDGSNATGSNNDDSASISVGAATYSLGNRLWIDMGAGSATNDGRFDAGDTAVPTGTEVDLLDGSGVRLGSTTTDANGYYRFDGLAAGDYQVSVPASAFAAGGPLAGYVPSTPSTSTFTAADNGVNHGLAAADPASTGVTTATVTLGTGVTGDGDSGATGAGAHGPTGDDYDNLTADLGFIQPFDLRLTKTVTSTGPYALNATVTYALVVRNNGPGLALSGFTVSDTLPAGLDFVSAAGTNWTVTSPAAAVTSPLTGTAVTLTHTGELAAGDAAETVTVTARVSSTSGGTFTNSAFTAPSPDQRTPETNPVGTTNGGYEDGSNATGSDNDDSAPITVNGVTYSLGNRLWFDTGAGAATDNGSDDSGEAPVVGAVVDLLDGAGNPVLDGSGDPLTATTDPNGYYRFDGLAAGTYRVRVAAADFRAGGPLENYLSSSGASADFGTSGNDADHGIDVPVPAVTGVSSNPVTLGGVPVTGDKDAGATGAGDNGPFGDVYDTLTADFGFVPSVSLGDRLWLDSGVSAADTDNGVVDAGEPPVVGATVELLDGNGDPVLVDGTPVTAVTDANGYYRFDGLTPGTYEVRVAAANFGAGQVLDGWRSSTPTSTDFTVNDVDHGGDAGIPGVDGVTSGPVTLTADNPLGDADAGATGAGAHGPSGDVNDNLTVDFGFAPTYSLGNRLWFDSGVSAADTDNGRYDSGEAPVVGATVQLLDGTGQPVLAGGSPVTAVTDANGFYRFDGLAAGRYQVLVTPANFQPGGVLADTVSSTGADLDSAAGDNDTDHGIDVPASALATSGVGSATVVLGPSANPTGEADAGATGAGGHGPTGDGNDNLTVDFGFVATFSLGNRIWSDTGAGDHADNGVLDADESGLGAVTVDLVDAAGTTVATTTTDASGYYRFDDVLPGTYTVVVDKANFAGGGPLADLYSSTGADPAFTAADNNRDHGIDAAAPAVTGVASSPVTVGAGLEPTDDGDAGATGAGAHGPAGDAADNLTADFGFFPGLSLGDRLWFDMGPGDETNNGIRDAEENPVPTGTSVQLLDPAGTVLATTATDAGGYYRFDGLHPGSYRVRVPGSDFATGGPLAGYSSSTGHSDAFDTASNNHDKGVDTPVADLPTAGVSSPLVTLTPGSLPLGDADTDGQHGPGGDAADQLTVDFGFVAQYDLTLTKAVTSKATPYQPTQTVTYRLTATDNGPGSALSGFTVSDRLPAGLTFVSASGANWAVTAQAGREVTLTYSGDGLAAGQSAPAITVTATVDVDASPGTLVNDAVVKPSPQQRNPETNPVGTTPDAYEDGSNTTGSNNDDSAPIVVAGPTFSLGNRLWFDTGTGAGQADNGRVDTGELPVVGATVNLLDADGRRVATTTTDANGYYRFDDLAAGRYRVQVAAANFAAGGPLAHDISSTGSSGDFTAAGNNVDHGIDAPNPSADGIVSAPLTLGPGVLGDGDAGATGAGGHGPLGDDDDNLTADFGFVPGLSLGNRLWFDSGAGSGQADNGKFDAGEKPVIGATVDLLDAAGTVVATTSTDGAGYYRFDGLPAGSYRVRVDATDFAAGGVLATWYSSSPTSADFSAAGNDLDHGIDVPAPATTGITSEPVTLTQGNPTGDADTGATGAGAHGPSGDAADNLTADFGFTQAFAVGDYVWIDANGNGRQDPSEKPLAGITVTLLDGAGQPARDLNGTVVPPVKTDANGHYVFDDLPPGRYQVQFSGLPAGFRFTAPSAPGTAAGNDSNPNASGRTPVVQVGPGQADTTAVQGSDGTVKATRIDRTIDAGVVPVLALGDYVWIDANGNGIQDPTEPPVPGVTVTLLDGNGKPARDADGKVVPPTTTDRTGHYVFGNLLPGTYQVVFTQTPPGYVFTRPNAPGSTPADDSNPGADGRTPVFTLAGNSPGLRTAVLGDHAGISGLILPDVNAGLVPVMALGDYMWVDTNGNGIQDGGEPPVVGATVTLLDGDGNPATAATGRPVPPTSTDANGHYVFDDLLPGTYRVRFGLPAGYSFTTRSAAGSSAADDSDAAGDGLTPVFVLAADGAGVRAVEPADGTSVALLIDPTIDAGIVLTAQPGGLSYTGAPVAREFWTGLFLLVLGGLFVMAGRRRRRPAA